MNRPFDRRSRFAAILASTTGGYNGTSVMVLTSSTRFVTPAMAASVMSALPVGPWNIMCSPVPRYEKPSSSARWVRSTQPGRSPPNTKPRRNLFVVMRRL